MNAIHGVYRDGQIILTEPTSWPNGTPVVVSPAAELETLGMCEEDWPTTPEGIAGCSRGWTRPSRSR